MKEIEGLIERLETEINKTPTGELRNLLCDANIILQQQIYDNNKIKEDKILLVTFYEKTYQLTNDEIKDGDSIYSEFAKTIDKCIKIYADGTMCVEFKSGNRAILSTLHYKKAILFKTK